MSEGLLSAAPVSLANPGLVYGHVEIRMFLCKHENLPVWIGLQDWGLRLSGQIEESLFKRLPVIWNQSGALLRSGIDQESAFPPSLVMFSAVNWNLLPVYMLFSYY